MSLLPAFTDEKLEEYLHIWDKLIEQGRRSILDITLTMDYGSFAFPLQQRYTLTYGEEKRALTYEQAWRVKTWLDGLSPWR